MNKEKAIDITVLLLRLAAGFIFIPAGGMKLFGWFGGLPAGVELSTLLLIAGILEVFGGALILFGLFTRPVAFILAGEMVVAYFIGHFPQGFWPILNHGEAAVLLAFIFLFLAAYGGGRWSLDSLIRSRRESSVVSGS